MVTKQDKTSTLALPLDRPRQMPSNEDGSSHLALTITRFAVFKRSHTNACNTHVADKAS